MDVMDEVGSISREVYEAKKKADNEDKLVPKGKWEGTVFTYNLIEEDERTPNDLRGKRVYSVGIVFYDCPEYGQKKTGFFKMTPDPDTHCIFCLPKLPFRPPSFHSLVDDIHLTYDGLLHLAHIVWINGLTLSIPYSLLSG